VARTTHGTRQRPAANWPGDRRPALGRQGAPTERLRKLAEPLVATAGREFEETSEKARVFGEMLYQAETWDHPRRVVIKAEVIPSHSHETNVRYVVANRSDLQAEQLYGFYVQRGDP